MVRSRAHDGVPGRYLTPIKEVFEVCTVLIALSKDYPP